MARMILGPLIESISNSIGATIISSWKGVTYARRKGAMMSNPCSEAQAEIRTRIATASKRWSNTLTTVQRAGWESYARAQGSASDSKDYDKSGSRVLIPDNRKVMSGFNAYLLNNALAFSAGTKAVGQWSDDSPNGTPPPNPVTALLCRCCPVQAPDRNIAFLQWTKPVGYQSSDRYRIWLASSDAGIHRQVAATIPGVNASVNINEVNAALGRPGPIDDHPGHYLFQVDCVSTHGQKSSPSNICQLFIPDYDVEQCPACPP